MKVVSIEIKINSYEEEMLVNNLSGSFSFVPTSKYKTYGYQVINYKVNRLDVRKLKEFWLSIFEDCRICTY